MSRARNRGSVSVVLAASLVFATLFVAFAADVTRASGAGARAQTAADAAALAAAQELVYPSPRSPTDLAAEYAERHGARVVRCRCEPGGEDVIVEVEVKVALPLLGQIRVVRRTARAEVVMPSGAQGLRPWFVFRLACLFASVPGLTIVSGFRTHAEQARLHRQKPDLAAPPGRSMHEVGLAADLGFVSVSARRAAHREATACNLEFPVPHEPWHIEPAV